MGRVQNRAFKRQDGPAAQWGEAGRGAVGDAVGVAQSGAVGRDDGRDRLQDSGTSEHAVLRVEVNGVDVAPAQTASDTFGDGPRVDELAAERLEIEIEPVEPRYRSPEQSAGQAWPMSVEELRLDIRAGGQDAA